MRPRTTGLLAVCLVLPLAGARAAEPEKPPRVEVTRPVSRTVTDNELFTGRLTAAQTVDIRPRVSGYLIRALFKEGADVKKGDLLFEIDPRPYQTELNRAKTTLDAAEARLKLAQAEYARNRALFTKAAVSREELDRSKSALDLARAQVAVAKATLDMARINFDFTRVMAPIDGRIGRRLLDPGNLVKADDTLLATIVSREPMYVYFDVDERTLLRLRRTARDGKARADTELPAWMSLADEKGYPHRGVVNFTDIRVDAATGTLRMRAVFANPTGFLLPGLFVRVRLPVGKPYKALLVPEGAVEPIKTRRFVYVVNEKDVVERRRVVLGGLDGGMRVVKEGLKPDDRVIVGVMPTSLVPRIVDGGPGDTPGNWWGDVQPGMKVKPHTASPASPGKPEKK